MAFKQNTSPRSAPLPIHIVGPKIAHFKAFWELAWANMDQIWLKIASNRLFEHPKLSKNNFGKNHFGPLLDPQVTRNPTLERAPCIVVVSTGH